MTFHQFSIGCGGNSFSSGPYNAISVSQNVYFNSNCISAISALYSSFPVESCPLSPCGRQMMMRYRSHSDPLDYGYTNNIAESYFHPPYTSSPDICQRFLSKSVYDCYNMYKTSLVSGPPYSGFVQQLDHKHSIGWNHQSSDLGYVGSGFNGTSVAQREHDLYPVCNEPLQMPDNWDGDISSAANHYSVNVMHKTGFETEDRRVFDIQSCLRNEEHAPWPAAPRCVHLIPLYAREPNVYTSRRTDILSMDCSDACMHINECREMTAKNVADLRTLGGCGLDIDDRIRCVDNKPGCIISSSPADRRVGQTVDVISTTAHEICGQTVPDEQPESQVPYVTCTPYTTVSHWHGMEAESTGYSALLSTPCSVSPGQTDVDKSTVLSADRPDGELHASGGDQQFVSGVTEIPICSSSNDSPTLCTSSTPAAVQFINCLSPANINVDRMQISFPEISSSAARPVCSSGTAWQEGNMIGAESGAVSCYSVSEDRSASDDVIVLSPSAMSTSSTAVHAESLVKKSTSCSTRMPINCLHGGQDTHPVSSTYRRPIVLNYQPDTLSHVHSNAVPLTSSNLQPSALAPFAARDRCKYVNYKNPTSYAVHAANDVCSVQGGCQGSLPFNHPTSTVSRTPCRMISCLDHSKLCAGAQTSCRSTVPVTGSAHSVNLGTSDHYVYGHINRDGLEPVSHMSLPVSRQTQQFNASERRLPVGFNSQNISTTVSSQSQHPACAAGASNPTGKIFRNHTFDTSSLCRRDRVKLQSDRISLIRNRTFSAAAAHVMLQRMKQPKLSDFLTPRATNHQLHYTRRLNALSRPSISDASLVIDLTEADDDGDEALTCESVFALVRRRAVKMPLLCQQRRNFIRRNSLVGQPCCYTKPQPLKKVCSTDKSLPFYRCFVQQLLRNYRFTASGLPVKVCPELMPPVVPSIISAVADTDSGVHAANFTYKKLPRDRVPVVVLVKLDDSLLHELGASETKSAASDGRLVSVCRTPQLEACVGRAFTAVTDTSHQYHSVGSETEEHMSSCSVYGSEPHFGPGISPEDRGSESEDVREPNVLVNVKGNARCCDELTSLCRPVSVVLERLDRSTIDRVCNNICESHPHRTSQQSVMRVDTEYSVADLHWTLTQIPRANKVPILLLRISPTSEQRTDRKKSAKGISKKWPTPTWQLRRLRNCTSNQTRTTSSYHNKRRTPVSANMNTTRKQVSRKLPGDLKMCLPSSTLSSLRSRNTSSHIVRNRILRRVAKPVCRTFPICRSKRSNSLLKVVKVANHTNKSGSEFTELKSDSQATVVMSTVAGEIYSLPVESSSENVFRTDGLVHNCVDGEEMALDGETSDSDTIPVSPHSSAGDSTIVYRSPLTDILDVDELSGEEQDSRLDVNRNLGDESRKSHEIEMERGQSPIHLSTDLSVYDTALSEPIVICQSSPCRSGSTQIPSNIQETSLSSKVLGHKLASHDALYRQEPSAVQLVSPAIESPHKQTSLDTFVFEVSDKDLKTSSMVSSILADFDVE